MSENGLLRVGGRIGNVECEYSRRFPALLDPSDQLSTLIVGESEIRRAYHGRVERVLVDIRRTYWVLKGRQLVKRIVTDRTQKSICYSCCALHGSAAS